jgi:hypothetical protein
MPYPLVDTRRLAFGWGGVEAISELIVDGGAEDRPAGNFALLPQQREASGLEVAFHPQVWSLLLIAR